MSAGTRIFAILLILSFIPFTVSAVTIAELRQSGGYSGNTTIVSITNNTYINETGITVLSEYSADGVTWQGSYTTGDIYIRFSYDGGNTWGQTILFQGPAGAMNMTANMTAGPQGPVGPTGATGATGPAGSAATVNVNDTFVSTTPNVVNVGSSSNALLDFYIPGSYPVGSVYLINNTNGVCSVNPGTFLGGTWILEGTGNVVVGG